MFKVRGLMAGLAAFGLMVMVSAVFAASVPPSQLTGALQWRSVGPYTGGRATTVVGVPGEPNLFYMATAGGGVWETDNYGQSWKPLTEKYFKPDTQGSVGALAVAPSNPKIIYAGSGDSAPRNTVTPGAGMYKSTDGGKTWTNIGLNNTRMINWIVVDPNNPDVVYVASLGHLFAPSQDGGVYKTTDGGQNWKKVLFVNDETGAITLAMDQQNPQVLYAGMWQMQRRAWGFTSGGPGSGLYKSTDGGATWKNISRDRGLPAGVWGKVGVAVAPSNGSVVYALIQANLAPGKPGGLYKSEDGGQTWKLINDSLDITQRAFYYGRVYVDPKDPATVYLPNVGVYVSHDSGKTLIALHPPHGDNHAFWINPNNPQILIEGNDGGATVSLNGGKSWSSEDNQPTGQFYHVNLDDQFPFHIYGAQQDRGSNDGPSAVARGNVPPVWTNVVGGEMSWVVPTPGTPWVTYGSGYYSMQWKENRRLGLITNVAPWPAYKFGLQGSDIKYRFGWWHHPAVFASPTELLFGANVLFKTTDEGIHWSVISPDLTRNDKSKQQRPGGPISADVTGEEMYDTISAIAVSPTNTNIIWTGSDDGLVYVTTDGGGHWNQVRPAALPTWSIITSIEPSHTEAGTAYVSADRYMWDDYKPYIYKTTDYGKTWTAITTGLPDNQYVDAVRQDPDEPNLLFAATSATVYVSFNGGAEWQPLTLNLPAVTVTDLEIQPAQHAVVISTFGRAFWVMDNLQFLEQLSSAQVSSDAAYLFKPQQTWLVTRGGGFGGGGIGGKNLDAGATVFFHLPANYRAGTPVKLSFTDASGKVINSFTLPEKPKTINLGFGPMKQGGVELRPGMNSYHWNLRYPNAVDVKGVFNSFFAAAPPVGPEVVPGTYYAVLDYAGSSLRQPFVVKLDPRLNTTQTELQQRFDLLMRIHVALTQLDTNLNDAIDARSDLEKSIANKSVSGGQAQQALAKLNTDIDNLVDLKIQSGEGGLVFPPRLRAWLTSIAGQVSMAFVPPTPSMVEVANMYIGEVGQAVPRLQSDVSAAKAAMKR